MAPEMFGDGLYTRSVDMWSVGVILYRLLTNGKYPFIPEELRKLAKDPKINIEDKFKEIRCSRNCMHLLRALLEPDVMKRMPYYVAFEHPFILQEDREPALRYFEIENAQELTAHLRQVFYPLLDVSVSLSFPLLEEFSRMCLCQASSSSTEQ